MKKEYEKSEKYLEKKLVREVEKRGGKCLKFWPITATGFPDRIVLLRGGFCSFAEIKSTGKNLTTIQKIWKDALENLGFTFWKIDSTESLNNYLLLLDKKICNK